MNRPFNIAMASALALATASPALAQYQYQDQPQYQPAPQYQPTERYQDDQRRYQDENADYQARKDAYEARREDYQATRDRYELNRAGYDAARADYARRRADWQRARAEYDARYGYGSYSRAYGAEPVWDGSRWVAYEPAPAASYYGRDTAYTAQTGCRNDNRSATTAGIIGALAGAALGSNVAARGHRTGGAILGGVVGAGLGAAVGNANDKFKCDSRGPYYGYNDTVAYREAYGYGERSGQYDSRDYQRMRCRLAAAPIDTDGQDYRYVRVCPDRNGRYRITG